MPTIDPNSSTDPGQWITRKEAAGLAGCDVDTIRRDIAKHGLPTRQRGQAVTVNIDDLVEIGRLDAATLNPSLSGTENATVGAIRAELVAQVAKTERSTGRLEEAHELVRLLQTQVKVKDAHILELTANITRLVACTTRGLA